MTFLCKGWYGLPWAVKVTHVILLDIRPNCTYNNALPPLKAPLCIFDHCQKQKTERSANKQRTARSWVLVWKLVVAQLIKTCPALYGTRKFITAFTRVRQYPKPQKDASRSPYILKIHFNIILPPACRTSKWSLSISFPHQNSVRISLLPYSCHTPRPYHPPSSDHPNNVGRAVQIMKLLIMKFSQVSCFFLYLRAIHLPQHPFSVIIQVRSFTQVLSQESSGQ